MNEEGLKDNGNVLINDKKMKHPQSNENLFLQPYIFPNRPFLQQLRHRELTPIHILINEFAHMRFNTQV